VGPPVIGDAGSRTPQAAAGAAAQFGFSASPARQSGIIAERSFLQGSLPLGVPAGRNTPPARRGTPPRAPLPVEQFRDAVAEARAAAAAWQPLHPARLPLLLLVLEGAGAPMLDEKRLASGEILLRVRQRLEDGTEVELLQWQEPGARQAGRASVETLVVSAAPSAAGGREVLLRAPALGTYVLVTAELDARRLAALAGALTLLR
jgi:hypothetical protein